MNKIATILVALLIGAVSFNAQAQLTIGKKSEGAKQLVTVSQMWAWLYEADGHIFYVSKTTNRFDDLMWLDFGESYDEAAQTAQALLDALNDAKDGDLLDIESLGEKYFLSCDVTLGAKTWLIHASDTRRTYAGEGQMYSGALKKAIKFLTK